MICGISNGQFQTKGDQFPLTPALSHQGRGGLDRVNIYSSVS
jgi:hypothetical protein